MRLVSATSVPRTARPVLGCWFQNVILVAGLIAISGCQDQEPGESVEQSPPFQGVSLRVAVPAGYQLTETLDPVVREWSAQTGAAVELINYSVAVSPGELAAAVSSANADVLIVPLNWLPDLDAAELLQPLADSPEGAAVLDWNDLFQGVDTAVATRNRRPTVVPIASPVLQCYYRSDLLAEADLEPPESWADYVELIQNRAVWAGDLPVLEPWHEDFLPTMFQARALAFTKHPENFSLLFDIATGKPLLDTAGFQRSVEVNRTILEQLPDEVRSMTPRDCFARLIAGEAAMVLAVECGRNSIGVPFAECDSELQPLTRERPDGVRIASCPLPGHPQVYDLSSREWRQLPETRINRATLTAIGGLGLCCGSKASGNALQAAVQLIRRLGVEQTSSAFPDGTRTITRESQFEAAAGWQSPGMTSGESRQNLRGIVQQLRSRQVVADLPVLERTRFRKVLQTELRAWRDGEVGDAEVLPRIQAKWQELADEIGVERIRDSYRRAVGLADLK